MKTVIEIKGFKIIAEDNILSIEGPDEDACADIGQAFLALIKAPKGAELITQYVQSYEKLVEVLDVPTVATDHPALDNLSDWLGKNPDFVFKVEEMLVPHGYEKL